MPPPVRAGARNSNIWYFKTWTFFDQLLTNVDILRNVLWSNLKKCSNIFQICEQFLKTGTFSLNNFKITVWTILKNTNKFENTNIFWKITKQFLKLLQKWKHDLFLKFVQIVESRNIFRNHKHFGDHFSNWWILFIFRTNLTIVNSFWFSQIFSEIPEHFRKIMNNF